MLNEGDRKMTEIVSVIFREKVGTEKTENPRVKYGESLLGINAGTPAAAAWFGFWLGFNAGIEFTFQRAKTEH